MNAITSRLASIIPENAVHIWENLEPSQQQSLQQGLLRQPDCLVYPHNQTELAAVIAEAHRQNWRIVPCGSGSKISWGGLVDAEIVVSTERMNQLIAHAVGDLTVTVEAGMGFSRLQEILAQSQQFVAIDPMLVNTCTIGGIISTADTNSLRQRYGSVRDHILGITFVRADGQIAKAGGRVVKNVAGYDLMKLFTGSYGTLGVISQVTFRVYPQPADRGTVVLTGDAQSILQVASQVRNSALTPTQADLLSEVSGLGLPSGCKLLVRFQSISESVQAQCDCLLAMGQSLGLVGKVYSNQEEDYLWQRLRDIIDNQPTNAPITCKIGILPTAAMEVLTQVNTALIHNGSGLGWLHLPDETQILQMRAICEQHRGFLTVVKAPKQVKQTVDIWGYSGNALGIMRQIKTQFDSKNILSPGRFVGGI